MLLAMAAGVGIFSINGSADRQHPFLETIKDGINMFRITVTGDDREVETLSVEQYGRVYYDSWNDVKKEHEDILIPEYIPDEFRLAEIFCDSSPTYLLFYGRYEDEGNKKNLKIYIWHFFNDYGEYEKINDENIVLLDEDKGKKVSYYETDTGFKAHFLHGQCMYEIDGTEMEELKNVVSNMK